MHQARHHHCTNTNQTDEHAPVAHVVSQQNERSTMTLVASEADVSYDPRLA